jgi:hypothetical protein
VDQVTVIGFRPVFKQTFISKACVKLLEMEKLIKFSIKGPQHIYRGLAKRVDTTARNLFEIQLSNGDKFYIEAKRAEEGQEEKILWTPFIGRKHIPLIPFIGERIESHYSKIGFPLFEVKQENKEADSQLR